jgi:hypothetical protein
MGYIFARLIYKGLRTMADVPDKYKAATRAAYKDLFGIDVPEVA